MPEELSSQAVVKVSNIEKDSRFFLICLTCRIILMQFKNDPESNANTRRVVRSATSDHIDAYTDLHTVEKIDLKTGASYAPFEQVKRIN